MARVVQGPFSGPADSEGVIATRPTRGYMVPPGIDIWARRQRILANGFGFGSRLRVRLDSGLPVLNDDSTVVLVL